MGGEKQPHRGRMAIGDGQMAGSVGADVLAGVDVGAELQEDGDGLTEALLSGEMERRAAVREGVELVGAEVDGESKLGDEEADELGSVCGDCGVQE